MVFTQDQIKPKDATKFQMLKELQVRHQEIVRLSFQGFTPNEISEKTGICVQRVYSILRDPLAKSFLDGLNDRANITILDTRKRLVTFEKLALDRAEEILGPESKSPDAAKVALIKDILDRNGYKATDKSEITHKFGNTSDDELDAKIRSMQESLTEMNAIEKSVESNSDDLDLDLDSDPNYIPQFEDNL